MKVLKKMCFLMVLSAFFTAALSGIGIESICNGQAAPRTSITVLTYGSGGSNYIQAGGVLKVAEKHIPNCSTTVQPTGGDLEMIRLLSRGKGDFAFVMLNSVSQALNGLKPYDQKYEFLRLFLVGQNAVFHMVVSDKSEIKSVPDLKGKKVSIGPAGSSSAQYMAPKVLNAFGLTINDIKGQMLSTTEAVNAIKDGTIDAAFLYLIPPGPAITDLAASNAIRLLPLTEEAKNNLTKLDKLLDFQVIAANTYKGQKEDVLATGLSCAIATSVNVPDETVYQLAKALDVHMDEWKEVHSGCAFYTPEKTLRFNSLPIHSGMEKYMKEKGMLK